MKDHPVADREEWTIIAKTHNLVLPMPMCVGDD